MTQLFHIRYNINKYISMGIYIETCQEEAKMHHINLHHLSTFEAVVEEGSFIRAAERLHFSQPAVSAQIRQLEAAMGLKLFDKIGHKTHLTQAGEELYRYSQKIFA